MAKSFLCIIFSFSLILSNTTFAFANHDSSVLRFYSPPNYHSWKTDTVPLLDAINFFVSNRGSDTNDGRSPSTPRLNIRSVEPLIASIPSTASKVLLNLEEGNLFREQYNPLKNNLQVSSFRLKDTKRLAKITGMDVISEWSKATSTQNVFQHLLEHSVELTSPGYTNIIIAEIDTSLEKSHPVSAVKYLTFTSDVGQCDNTPGSYYTPENRTNPVMIYIHPTEGSPGKNKFRYEVTTRNYNINGYNIDNVTLENLYLQSSAQGYGMLSAGKNTIINNSIFQGGGTHHMVLKSGHIDSCLFLPGPKGLKDRIAAVFYSLEGQDFNDKITNTIFLDIPNAVYAHTNGETNHRSLLLDKVYAFGDSTDAITAFSANDTDSIEVSNCFVDNYAYGWYFGGGRKLNITNSIFRNINQAAIMPISKSNVTGEVRVNNVLIETNGSDKNQNPVNGWTAHGVLSPYNNVNVEVSNTIFHCYSTWHGPSQTVTTFRVAGLLKAHHNIYICDVNDNNAVHIYPANNSGGLGTSNNVLSDSNAFVLVRGSQFHWVVAPNNNNESNLFTLAEWQSLTGQDKHSVFIDVRNNPLGLKAIFVDPENGNWTLAQSLQADAIRKISAGMTAPPLFYPRRPSLENDSMPFKTPAGVSSFSGQIKEESESVVQWQTFNESEFSSFGLEYSLDGTHFLKAGSIKAINDNMNHSYEYLHIHPNADSIFYRLNCFNGDSTNFFSTVIKLKGNFLREFDISVYPNPFQHTITVAHPRRDAAEISIYDYSGRLIKIVPVMARSSKTLISLYNLKAGSYFVQWSSNQEKLGKMILK